MRQTNRHRRQRHFHQLQHGGRCLDRFDDHGTSDQASDLLARLSSSTTSAHRHIQRRVHRHCMCSRATYPDHSASTLRSRRTGSLGNRGKQHECCYGHSARSKKFLRQSLGPDMEAVLWSAGLGGWPVEQSHQLAEPCHRQRSGEVLGKYESNPSPTQQD